MGLVKESFWGKFLNSLQDIIRLILVTMENFLSNLQNSIQPITFIFLGILFLVCFFYLSRFVKDYFSSGTLIVISLAVISTLILSFWRIEKKSGLLMWTYAEAHTKMYRPLLETWNTKAKNPEDKLNLLLLGPEPLVQRLMSGFVSDTPLPDLVEINIDKIGYFFAGPIEHIGMKDLTNLIKAEGFFGKINKPSFSPWMKNGRIFCIPHDVHPVLLTYRSDIVESAGIDVNEIETWDDFERILKPLQTDDDGDGRIDHFLLNIWSTDLNNIESLILQAGGAFFDDKQNPVINSAVNARVIAKIVSWIAEGPDRIATEAKEFDPAGHKMRREGYVICSIAPDWLTGVWKQEIPELEGKLKVMPLPAWEKGGRRSSVLGGTGLAIPKNSKNFKLAWQYAKKLYFSKKNAEFLFETNNIISPVKKFWSEPMYKKPDPYFSNQRVGEIYIKYAGTIPRRTSSPFNAAARAKISEAVIALKLFAEKNQKWEADELLPQAKDLLNKAQKSIIRTMDRNFFIKRERAEN